MTNALGGIMSLSGLMNDNSVIFDHSSSHWTKNIEMNKMFLHLQQNYFNQVLRNRGHVFLNEIYDALGVKRTCAGQFVGWVIDGVHGADFVGFDIIDFDVNDDEPEHYLVVNFNDNGVIIDRVDWSRS